MTCRSASPVAAIVSATAYDPLMHRRAFPFKDGRSIEVPPFLKWAGGKRWLLPLAHSLRKLTIHRYFEPFLGSGAMFFGLRPAKSHLGDSNSDLIETYRAVQQDWKAVQRKLKEHHHRHTAEYYYRVRAATPRTPHTRAARFIYLNRTCWNGLYRVNRKGIFNTPVGSKTGAVLESDAFDQVSQLLDSATLTAGDFEDQINLATSGDLVFADPPYTVRHQYNGFIKYNEKLFSWDDQERLHEAICRAKDRGAFIICTNADHQSIRELYGSSFQLSSLERYSAIAGTGGTRGKYGELLITS